MTIVLFLISYVLAYKLGKAEAHADMKRAANVITRLEDWRKR
jgi:hypothetical protein